MFLARKNNGTSIKLYEKNANMYIQIFIEVSVMIIFCNIQYLFSPYFFIRVPVLWSLPPL